MIDTEGKVTGQINALSVLQLGEISFGQPSRVTATTRLGSGKVVDIEREIELGGAIHSKGVLILSSFIAAKYARKTLFSIGASLVFEQSYGHVEGDSASLAELCAILSIFLAGLRPRPLGRKERPATSEATLLYWARIGEGMQTPSQSLASSQRDVSLLLF